MSETQRSDPRLDKASEWFTLLNKSTVSHQALAEFRDWRQTPANAEAYARIEALWGKAGALLDDPEIAAATQGLRRRRSIGALLAGIWAAVARRPVIGIGIAVATGAIGFLAMQATQGAAYETGVGEQRVVRLDDGSVVRLDTDSRVRVRLTATERDLDLVRGQAQFEVAHDPHRPFNVAADGVTVRAVGTRFDVRRYDNAVKVTLVEGRVQVIDTKSTTSGVWSLEPGQQVITGQQQRAPRAVDVASATSWTRGNLVFREQSLEAAVAEVNRYSRRKIQLDSRRYASTPVSGVFVGGDIDAFLDAVTALHPLERTAGPDGAIVLRERTGAQP